MLVAGLSYRSKSVEFLHKQIELNLTGRTEERSHRVYLILDVISSVCLESSA